MNNGEFINYYRRSGIAVLGETKRQFKIIDFVVPGYQNVKSKEEEKILKSEDSEWNLECESCYCSDSGWGISNTNQSHSKKIVNKSSLYREKKVWNIEGLVLQY